MKNLSKLNQKKHTRRSERVRAKVRGVKERPRLSIFKSNRFIYAQIIDDKTGTTLAQAQDFNEKEVSKTKNKELSGKILKAYAVGELIAKRALDKGVKRVVFDRGGYKYYGRVKAVADGARKEGLEF